MPSLCVRLSHEADSHIVTAMLQRVPERGHDLHVVRAGSHVLGLAVDERLPNESSWCEQDGWAAVVVGSVDGAFDASRPHRSSAAMVLDAVRRHGGSGFNELRGAFAAVVSDGARAWAARDHVGTEPLYVREQEGVLLLVSEPKQLEAVPGLELRPDTEVVEAIFYGEEYAPERSVYRDVRRLGMASFLEWDGRRASVQRYWTPERLFETARFRADELTDRFHFLLEQAARRVLRGQDAVLLSGGIDSPAVAAYAAAAVNGNGRRPIGAISAVYPQHPSVDERPLIEMVVRRYGLELHTYTPGHLRLDRLDEWVRMFDGPWASWHPGWAEETYRFAADRGYSVLLTGFFAENVADLNRGVIPHLVSHGRFRAAAAYLRDKNRRGGNREWALRQLLAVGAPRWLRAAARQRRPNAIVPPWMDRDRLGRRDADQAVAPRTHWRTAQLGFIGGTHPAMEAYAKLQARAGVRVRHPWSDVDLWEFFISLPAEVKHPDSRSKALLRNLLRGRVPDPILDRGKMVFNSYLGDSIDYPSLRRWLVHSPVEIDGIDYGLLRSRLEAEQLTFPEYLSAKDLATAHAFLAQWA